MEIQRSGLKKVSFSISKIMFVILAIAILLLPFTAPAVIHIHYTWFFMGPNLFSGFLIIAAYLAIRTDQFRYFLVALFSYLPLMGVFMLFGDEQSIKRDILMIAGVVMCVGTVGVTFRKGHWLSSVITMPALFGCSCCVKHILMEHGWEFPG